LGGYDLCCDGAPVLLFTDNESNEERYGGKSASPYTKDAFSSHLVQEETNAVNPRKPAPKSAAHYDLKVPGRQECDSPSAFDEGGGDRKAAFNDFSSTMELRRKEADDFYRLGLAAACLRG